MRSLGRQIVAEFYACNPTRLNDVAIIRDALLEAAQRAGATIVNQAFHHFSPHGVSGAVIIAESHQMCSALPKRHYIDTHLAGTWLRRCGSVYLRRHGVVRGRLRLFARGVAGRTYLYPGAAPGAGGPDEHSRPYD